MNSVSIKLTDVKYHSDVLTNTAQTRKVIKREYTAQYTLIIFNLYQTLIYNRRLKNINSISKNEVNIKLSDCFALNIWLCFTYKL